MKLYESFSCERIDWAIIQSYKHKRDESVADFQICLEKIFRQHSGLRDSKANIVLSAHFVNGLHPELNDLLKKHKLEQEITPLSKLQHLAEYFERIFRQWRSSSK